MSYIEHDHYGRRTAAHHRHLETSLSSRPDVAVVVQEVGEASLKSTVNFTSFHRRLSAVRPPPPQSWIFDPGTTALETLANCNARDWVEAVL